MLWEGRGRGSDNTKYLFKHLKCKTLWNLDILEKGIFSVFAQTLQGIFWILQMGKYFTHI